MCVCACSVSGYLVQNSVMYTVVSSTVCVCVRERERERENSLGTRLHYNTIQLSTTAYWAILLLECFTLCYIYIDFCLKVKDMHWGGHLVVCAPSLTIAVQTWVLCTASCVGWVQHAQCHARVQKTTHKSHTLTCTLRSILNSSILLEDINFLYMKITKSNN